MKGSCNVYNGVKVFDTEHGTTDFQKHVKSHTGELTDVMQACITQSVKQNVTDAVAEAYIRGIRRLATALFGVGKGLKPTSMVNV